MLETVFRSSRIGKLEKIVCLVFASTLIHSWRGEATTVSAIGNNTQCGGVLRAPQGIVQTPNFPGKFKVPIKCKWVIDTGSHSINSTLTVHLTQMYVTTGLKFSELPFYDPEFSFALGEKFGESPIHSVTENNVLVINWLKTDSQFLVIDFELDQLEGNHIRALDNLLDVFGFNITYQVRKNTPKVDKDSTCSVVACSYSGHCFASQNFSKYRCSCFHGFFGKDCGQGPLCRPDRNPCLNNGTCKHVGSSMVTCNCPASFTGSRCETLIQTHSSECTGAKEHDCVSYCPERPNEPPCSCKMVPVKDLAERFRYQITIHAAFQPVENTSSKENFKIHSNRLFIHQFEKSISNYMKRKVSSLEALRVLNISLTGEIIFYFYGSNLEGESVRASIEQLMEEGKLGNATFLSTEFSYKDEPALFVKDVKVSQEGRAVRPGDEFVITCTASGSPLITFKWFKNDMPINITKATREISITDSQNHILDHYLSTLTVKSADQLDSGTYTCQAIDWNFQHCRSIRLEILSPPSVKVTPLTASVQKGHSFNIICTWSVIVEDPKSVYGYSWLKESKDTPNKVHLFRMKEGSEVWEDLQPVGSILRVYNIQKSTKYICQVQSRAESVEASADVEVLNKSANPWCEGDDTGMGGIHWTQIGAWGVSKVECPARYTGQATRLCSITATGRAVWLTPDYSSCVSEDLDKLSENFKKVTLGYGSVTGAYTMSKIYELLKDRSRLYPGEGETFLTLVQNISWYLNKTAAWQELLQSTPAFYNIINIILQHSNSIINSQKLIDLQNLVNHWTITWAKHSRMNKASVSSYESLMIHTFSFNSSSSKLEYKFDISGNIRGYQSWSRTAVNILIARESLLLHKNTYSIAIIIYKDLMKYLPERQIYKMEDGTEYEYEMVASVVSLVGSSPMQVTVDIRVATVMRPGWNVTCAAMTTPTTRWLLEKCTVSIDLEASVTRCTCPMLATITALLTKTAIQNGRKSTPKSDVVLILGCLCCIFQCSITTVLLLMRWYNNPSCLIFLKIQCCISITAVAVVFFSAARCSIKESSYPFSILGLEAFFLLGLSSHLTKLLLVYTEITYLPKVKDMKLTVVGVINGFTLLIVLCNQLSYNSTRWRLESWWLLEGTFIFYAFIICISVMSIMFLFLYISVMRRLSQLSGLKSISKESEKAIKKRVCLLGRAALLFITILVMAFMSIVYVNYPGFKSQYAFSLTCALAGFVLLACYVIQSEASLHLHIMENFGTRKVCSSDSESNILNFFTKQDGETESECAPPATKESIICRKESIQLKEMAFHGLSPTCKKKVNGSLGSIAFPADLVQGCEPLKSASTLPKRRQKQVVTRSESISNIAGDSKSDHLSGELKVKPSYTPRSLDVLQSCQFHQDIVTTRVCVELGLITNSNRSPFKSEGPSIVLCSVDIEPSPGKVVELNEVTVKTVTTDVDGNGSSNSNSVSCSRNGEQIQDLRISSNQSRLDRDNGNDGETLKEGDRSDHDVLNRISSDLHFLLKDYDSNGNTNCRAAQIEDGTSRSAIRSSVVIENANRNIDDEELLGKTKL